MIRFCSPFNKNSSKPASMEIHYTDQKKQMLLSKANISKMQLQRSKVQPQKGNKDKIQIQKEQPISTPTPQELPEQIVHKVHYGDTLQGLSLEYSVPIGKIRYRNHIQGDSIYHLKEIIIPNPVTAPPSKQTTQDLLVEQFVGLMDYSQKSAKVARYYLLQADWNMENALQQYKDDLAWERKNQAKIVSQPLQANPGSWIQMKEIKRFYQKKDLLQKKRQ